MTQYLLKYSISDLKILISRVVVVVQMVEIQNFPPHWFRHTGSATPTLMARQDCATEKGRQELHEEDVLHRAVILTQ